MAGIKYSTELTAERLRELTTYSSETGLFRWRALTSKYSHAKIGDVAGWLNGDGYRDIQIDCKTYRAHRLAWLYVHGVWPSDQVDHINRDRTDNRIENLREASNTENQRNASKPYTNTSGHVGVAWHKYTQKWRAYIRHDGKNLHLGLFTELEDAVAARKAGELKYWGAIRAE